MKKIVIVLLALLFLVPALPASAQIKRADTNVTIDLQDLDDFTRNAVLRKMKEKENAGKGIMESVKEVDPNSVQLWADVVTKTIKTICRDLSIEANEFIKTPVGMIVAGTIVYKVVGQDVFRSLKSLVFGILGWVITMLAIYFVARKFIIPRKIKTTTSWNDKEKGKVTELSFAFVQPYEFKQNGEAKPLAVIAMVICAIVITIIAIVTVL